MRIAVGRELARALAMLEEDGPRERYEMHYAWDLERVTLEAWAFQGPGILSVPAGVVLLGLALYAPTSGWRETERAWPSIDRRVGWVPGQGWAAMLEDDRTGDALPPAQPLPYGHRPWYHVPREQLEHVVLTALHYQPPHEKFLTY